VPLAEYFAVYSTGKAVYPVNLKHVKAIESPERGEMLI
jgi:hypothetical protein